MSTVIGLNDLAEDEIISRPLPMNLFLNNLKMTLIEDRPPVNITSPGAVPINLQIGQMHIKRNEMGIFEIQPLADLTNGVVTQTNGKPTDAEQVARKRELISLQLIMQQLKIDNDSLKKQMISMEKSNDINT